MKYVVDGLKDFNLDHIFDCGQCFRWKKEENGSYTGVAKGKIANMSFEDGTLIIDNSTEKDFNEIWKSYLDLDRNYGEIKEFLKANDQVINDAIEYGQGIRILQQDVWEAIVSFIISQNNHIPRIKGCIDNLSKEFGSFVGNYKGVDYYSLPSPEKLASLSEEELAPVKLGYRAKYLIETGKQVTEKGMPKNYEEVLALTGVGPKVANCICLFGLAKMDSFPIDVWVKRVMNKLYGFEEKDVKGMEAFAKERFGDLGGIAQQYLFYYMRNFSNENGEK